MITEHKKANTDLPQRSVVQTFDDEYVGHQALQQGIVWTAKNALCRSCRQMALMHQPACHRIKFVSHVCQREGRGAAQHCTFGQAIILGPACLY